MKNKIIFTVTLLACSLCFCQQQITWKDLAKVTYTDKFYPEFDDYFMYPKFSLSVKELHGKKITLTGYFLNIDPKSKLYILSKGPMAACFFCGQAGPETAVELRFINKPKFKTDDIVSITGTLQLNKDDVKHFNFILQECTGKLMK